MKRERSLLFNRFDPGAIVEAERKHAKPGLPEGALTRQPQRVDIARTTSWSRGEDPMVRAHAQEARKEDPLRW